MKGERKEVNQCSGNRKKGGKEWTVKEKDNKKVYRSV